MAVVPAVPPASADFLTAAGQPTGEGFPEAVAAGDFDADGVVDLAVVPTDRDANGVLPSRRVGVLAGRGDGTFAAPVEHGVGERPRDLVAADFDGDGRPDLATANFDTSDVSVLRNSASGAFAPTQTLEAGSGPRKLVAGDFDGDGRPDLAVANFNSNDVSVLLSRPGATFATARSSAAGPAPISLAAGDFNGDGRLDLAVGNLVVDGPTVADKEVSILLGDGAGGFAAPSTVDVGVDADGQSGRGAQPVDLVAADLDGDGTTDLAAVVDPDNVASAWPKQRVNMLHGRGDATFDPFRSYVAGANPSAVATGDFDADGRADLAVTNAGSHNVSILGGGVGGVLTPVGDYATGGAPSALVVLDVDGDARPDVIATDAASREATVLLGNGDGTFAGARTSSTGGAGPTDVAAGDFDGDGLTDLAVTNSGPSAVHVAVMYGNGDASFRLAAPLSTGHTPRAVVTADLNRDGRSDLAVASWAYPQDSAPGVLSVFLRNAVGTGFTRTNQVVGVRPRAVVVADLNGDIDLDIAVGNDSGTVSVLLGGPGGTFPAPAVSYPAGGAPTSLAVADFDGDGNADLAVGNRGTSSAPQPTVSALIGTGTGSFTAPQAHPVGVSPDALAAGDVDGDARADLAVVGPPFVTQSSGSRGAAEILFAVPPGGGALFRSSTPYEVGTNPGSAILADLDGDGDLDLAITTLRRVSVLSNNGGGTFSAPVDATAGVAPAAVVAGHFGGGSGPDLAVVNLGGANNPIANTVSVLVDLPGPGVPTGVHAVAGNRSAEVRWTAPTDAGDAALATYTVAGFAGPTEMTRVTVPAGQREVEIGDLTNGTQYRFRVTATNQAGAAGRRSAPSNVVVPAAVPGAPRAVVAEAGNGSAVVRWEPPADNGGLAVTSYTVTTSRAGVEVASTTTPDARRNTVVTGLANGTEHIFRVAATNPVGTGPLSAPSGPVIPVPPPVTVVPPSLDGTQAGRNGYRLAAADGGVFAFGDARFLGSTGALRLSSPVVGMAATPTGAGYWLVAADGGVFAFGDARFLGSTGALRLSRPVVAMAASPTGRGYWLVAADGGVFAFGDARYAGSAGALRLSRPVVGLAASPTGNGYWLVASDGGVFAFGDARFLGSTGALRLSRPVVAMAASATGRGYWLVASDGGVFAFGDASFSGSTGALTLRSPVAGVAAA